MASRTPLTQREKRILLSELRSAASDARALVGSFLGALSLLSLAEIEITLPPLAWLSTRWSQICELFWTYSLTWTPVEISLSRFTTDSASFFIVLGFMFLRGHRAGYAGQKVFSIQAQDFLARLLYYLLVAFTIVRIRPVLAYAFSAPPTQGRYAGWLIGLATVLLTGFYLFRRYVSFIRKTRIIPRLLARPWLIFLGPVLVVVFEALLPEPVFGPAPENVTLFIIGVIIMISDLFLVLFLFFFGAPIGAWFVRILAAMILTTGSLFLLDTSWHLLKTSVAEPAPPAAPAAAVTSPSTAPRPPALAATTVETTSATPKVEKRLLKPALGEFVVTLEGKGTTGAIGLVNGCYATLNRKRTIAAMDRCLTIDLIGVKFYSTFARYYKVTTPEGVEFFTGDGCILRMARACAKHDIEPEPCRQRMLTINELLEPVVVEFMRDF